MTPYTTLQNTDIVFSLREFTDASEEAAVTFLKIAPCTPQALPGRFAFLLLQPTHHCGQCSRLCFTGAVFTSFASLSVVWRQQMKLWMLQQAGMSPHSFQLWLRARYRVFQK